MVSLFGTHEDEMKSMLRNMLTLRRALPAWNFLLNGNPIDDARLLTSAKLHHISGSMNTKALANVPDMPSDSVGAICALQSFATEQSIPLNTAWYYVPHRSFGHVSVGAVVSENDDRKHILFRDRISNRYTRYARDDINGKFLSITFDEQQQHAEVFFISPVSTTERLRVFIRFDYAKFKAVCEESCGDANADANLLFEAIIKSNIVKEYRNCSQCEKLPGHCNCSVLPLICPTSEFDLKNNAKNMLEQVGSFVGFSYYYIASTPNGPYVGEFMTQCNMNGGSACADDSRRLLTWAIQNRLYECPMNIMTAMHQPTFAIESFTPPEHDIASSDVSNDPIITELGDSFADDDNGNILLSFDTAPHTRSEVSDLSVPSSCDLLLQPALAPAFTVAAALTPPPMLCAAALTPPQVLTGPPKLLDGSISSPAALNALPPDLIVPTQLSPSLLSRPVYVPSPSSPVISKKKRRGRRPRPVVTRLPNLVRIAPAAGSSALPQGRYGDFQTEEEYNKHQKTLRSRMSAAKSNAKRREKRLEKQRLIEKQGNQMGTLVN